MIQRIQMVLILMAMLIIMPAFALAATVDLPKTGQTTPYAAGDDGDLQEGVAWPSPRFTDNLDGTVTDNLTGLMWTKNANLDGLKTWANALTYVDTLTIDIYNDWRLPNRKELRSLMDYGEINPSLPSGHPFINVQLGGGDFYWSSTIAAYDTDNAWISSALDGYLGSFDRTLTQYVWPVRGTTALPAQLAKTGQTTSSAAGDDGDLEKGVAWPSPRFTDNGDGTVTDNLTGLMWAQDANLDGTKPWADALTYVSGLNLATHDDWRLPNVNELESLINAEEASSAAWLNTLGFTDVQAAIYWTSTTYDNNTANAWVVNMEAGWVIATNPKASLFDLWPVRTKTASDDTARDTGCFIATAGQ
jgi:hypothetical protein